MRYLLDTHSLIWFLAGDERLSLNARKIIENEENIIFISIASLWEISIKSSLGKLELIKPFEILFPQQLQENEIEIIGIKVEHLIVLSKLPFHHRDPFDRLIIAQAMVENVAIISKDSLFALYEVQLLW